jgi:hypothetical protein
MANFKLYIKIYKGLFLVVVEFYNIARYLLNVIAVSISVLNMFVLFIILLHIFFSNLFKVQNFIVIKMIGLLCISDALVEMLT